MNTQNAKIILTSLVIIFGCAGVLCRADEEASAGGDSSCVYSTAGVAQGTGTCFEITDGDYLKVRMRSSEPVNVVLESVPQMITIDISAAGGAADMTLLDLAGLETQAVYYMYEDDLHRHQELAANESGEAAFEQDLTVHHVIFIQPRPTTRFIPSDAEIGVWDAEQRVYTLTADVAEAIQIDEDNLTLDGAGHLVTGSGTGNGIYLFGRTNVVVTALTVDNFANAVHLNACDNITISANTLGGSSYGIYLRDSMSCVIENNNLSDNLRGAYLYFSSLNEISNNLANNNTYSGLYLYRSEENKLLENTLHGNDYGIQILSSSHSNELTCNVLSQNTTALMLDSSRLNLISDNTFQDSASYGVLLQYTCTSNILTFNVLAGSAGQGLYMGRWSNNNSIYNNNFIDNAVQAGAFPGTSNKFYDSLAGGNFYSDCTGTDENGDGIIDQPYTIAGSIDYMPLAVEALLHCSVPPIANAGTDQQVIEGDTVQLSGQASYDPDDDEITYLWMIVSAPEESVAELAEPESMSTTFVADAAGIYVISLVVNDGSSDSEPDEMVITALTIPEAVAAKLTEVKELISAMPDEDFKCKKSADVLCKKIDVVIAMVEAGLYQSAAAKLCHDIMEKTDGCAKKGRPDKDDLIITCLAQEQVYGLMSESSTLIKSLIEKPHPCWKKHHAWMKHLCGRFKPVFSKLGKACMLAKKHK